MREALALHLGKSVQAYRLVGKLSREQLADKLGLTRQYIALIEDGERLPSLPILYELGAAFDVEPSSLLPTRRQVR